MENTSLRNKVCGKNQRVVVTLICFIGLISAAIYAFNFRIGELLPMFWQTTTIHTYLGLFTILAILYLTAVWLVINCLRAPGQYNILFVVIIVLAVFFRLSLVIEEPVVLSNDMYRFVWDARVQHNGYNPYRFPPGADELKDLRDDNIYPHINRKHARTLYPAGAQLFFRLVYSIVGDSVAGFKASMVVCDISALAVMVALLKLKGYDPNRLLIYAWNPLVIFEIAYSGHLEGITVLLMMCAFYLAAKRRKMCGLVMLALSSSIKLYPALLLPSLLNRDNRIKGSVIFATAFGLLYLPFMAAGKKVLGFLPIYLENPYESFNLGLKSLMMHIFPDLNYFMLSLLFICGLLAIAAVILFRNKIDELHEGYTLAGWLIILMPAALHPWYVILIIPFLLFYPNAGWMIFSCLVTLSYVKYVTPQGIMPAWVLLCEYLPLMVLLAAGFFYKPLGFGATHPRRNQAEGSR